MKRGIIWVLPALAGISGTLLAEPAPATQGEFAVELSSRLALGQGFILEEDEAIEALDRIGIRPGGGWNPEGPATERFVRQIHESIEALLENLSRDMNIPLPPEARGAEARR
jgi:hypothetical protein